MASPFDIKKAEDDRKKELYLPRKIDLAVNLIQSFIRNNNSLGLRIAIILAGAREHIEYDKDNGVTFNVDDLCLLCRIDRKYLYTNKRKMLDTYYEFVDKDGNLNGTKPITSFTYSNRNRDIRIEVSSLAKSLFNNLKSKKNIKGFQFTNAISKNLMIYDLKDVNKHTLKMQMLLEMINNFSHSKRKYFCLEELNMYFGTKYKRFGDIYRYILAPVKQDTLKYASISFVTTEKTEINKIVGTTITIQDNQNLFTK